MIRAEDDNRSEEVARSGHSSQEIDQNGGKSPSLIDQSLRGSLPCFVCGYELKGLSIRGVCPECGTAVRGTILYRVDPKADEFKPIRWPMLSAWGVRFWGTAPAAAAISLWILRLSEYSGLAGRRSGADSIWSTFSVVAVLASAVGAVFMIRPNRWIPLRKSLLVATGVGFYAVILLGMFIVIQTDMDKIPAYGHQRQLDPTREVGRLIFGVGVLGVLLCMRPMARELVKRCLALRTGRVDRQTILAMSAVVALGLVGDGIRWMVATGTMTDASGVMDFIGRLLVIVSSLLLTLGLISGAIDSWRISRAILTPSPSMSDLFGSSQSASSAGSGTDDARLSADAPC
ncbi:MAG: hypothetical protein ACNA8P_01545 [Phycisphaerales bacterium]